MHDDDFYKSFHNETRGVIDNRPEPNSLSSLGIILLATLTALANLCLFFPAYFSRLRRRRLIEQRLLAQWFANNGRRTRNVTARYNDVENWIMSRKVVAHDPICARLRGPRKGIRSNDAPASPHSQYDERLDDFEVSTNTDTMEDDDEESSSHFPDGPRVQERCVRVSPRHTDGSPRSMGTTTTTTARECPICLDAIRVGDIASWSTNPRCNHTFHHACIKEWLLQSNNCPFCRATFLAVDDLPRSNQLDGLADAAQRDAVLLSAKKEQSKHCIFCTEHGVRFIPLDRPSNIGLLDWQGLVEREARNLPNRASLIALRAQREDESDDLESGRSENDVNASPSSNSSNPTHSFSRDSEVPTDGQRANSFASDFSHLAGMISRESLISPRLDLMDEASSFDNPHRPLSVNQLSDSKFEASVSPQDETKLLPVAMRNAQEVGRQDEERNLQTDENPETATCDRL